MSTIVLASKSMIRRRILIDAGLVVDIVAPGVNEDVIKKKMKGKDGETIALALAEAKARAVSLRRLDDWVIGADQMLRFDGRLYDKAISVDAAETRLREMRGREHELIGAVALAKAGEIKHAYVGIVKMTMRDFSDEYLKSYLDHAGEGILSSVGGYEYEALGVQLFERVEGDFFNILGLPLLPLLAMLRAEGALPA